MHWAWQGSGPVKRANWECAGVHICNYRTTSLPAGKSGIFQVMTVRIWIFFHSRRPQTLKNNGKKLPKEPRHTEEPIFLYTGQAVIHEIKFRSCRQNGLIEKRFRSNFKSTPISFQGGCSRLQDRTGHDGVHKTRARVCSMGGSSTFLGLHRNHAELKIFLRALSGNKITSSFRWKLERVRGDRPGFDNISILH